MFGDVWMLRLVFRLSNTDYTPGLRKYKLMLEPLSVKLANFVKLDQ